MISYFGHSDVGRQRKQNEDSILTSGRLFLVCDGMGGRKSGEVASKLAVETIERETANLDGNSASEGHERLRAAIRNANAAIRDVAKSSDTYSGMGTTVAVVMVDEERSKAAYANVGDSRVYLFRAGTISQLSRDDSWVNAAFGSEVDEGSAGALQNVLTKALGTHETLDFEIKEHELVDGDLLLLCSDGLTTMVPDREILTIVTKHGHDLRAAARELIAAANQAGGRDNISAVLIRYDN